MRMACPAGFFFRRGAAGAEITCHLHIVEYSTWNERDERLLRDYLLAHPDDAQAYGELKIHLAVEHAHDRLA